MPKKNSSDYPVGYGKPPKHSQFKPGNSGNPNGRPRKAPTIIDAFLKQARKVVTVPTKTGSQRMSMMDLLAAQHWGLAVKGNPKSTAIVVRALTPSETNHENNLGDLLQEFREKNARLDGESELFEKRDDVDSGSDK